MGKHPVGFHGEVAGLCHVGEGECDMYWMFVLLVALGGCVVVAVSFLVRAIGEFAAARRADQRVQRDRLVRMACARLFAVAVMSLVPFLAVPLAEGSTGWRDTDADGLLDGFSNGSYDWLPVNGLAWLAIVAAGWLVVIAMAFEVLCQVRQAGATSEGHRWWRPED